MIPDAYGPAFDKALARYQRGSDPALRCECGEDKSEDADRCDHCKEVCEMCKGRRVIGWTEVETEYDADGACGANTTNISEPCPDCAEEIQEDE